MTRRNLLGLLAGLLVAALAALRKRRERHGYGVAYRISDGKGGEGALLWGWHEPDEGKFAPNMACWSRGVSEARPSEPGSWGILKGRAVYLDGEEQARLHCSSSTHDDFVAF